MAGALVAVAGCQGDAAQQTRDEWTSYLRLDRAAAVAPAPDGGAWVGTHTAGLVRWSRGGTEHERHPLPAGLDDPDLSAVAVADGGAVWVAAADPRVTHPDPGITHPDPDAAPSTRASPAADAEAEADRAPGDAASGSVGGVARFADGQWTTWTAGDGLAHSAVTALAVAGDESVWAATPQGLSHFDGDGWTTYTRADGLAHDRVVSVAAGDDGTVWAVTRSEPRGAAATPDEHGDGGDADPQPPQFGLSRLDGDEWTTWTTGDDLDASHPGRLAVADDGSVWIDVSFGPDSPQGPGSALAHFDGQRWRTWTGDDDHHGLGLGGAKALAVADDGAVWAATTEGVARFADGQWTTWRGDDELAGDPVNAVAAAGGTVWAATAHGVSVFDGQGWTTWATDSSPPGKLDDLAVAGDGAVWAAITHGVARFADGRWTTWRPRDSGLEGFTGYSVAADGQAVWAATLDGFDGLARFRAGEWTTHMPPRSGGDGQPSGYRITDLAVTEDATVWAVGDRGVVRVADGQWTTWTAADGLPRKRVTDLAIGDDGTVWAAAQQSGVWRFANGQWTAATTDDGLGAESVQALAAGGGTVWAGTHASGVWRFDGNGWSAVDAALPARRVTSLALADDGTLWVATGRATATGAPAGGVARFDGGKWTTWTADDGLAAQWIDAVAVGDDGTVWAGSDHGLSRFTP